MLNVATLEPCPSCKRSLVMLMPAKGEQWYLTCSKCHYHTESYDDAEEARAEWDDPDTTVVRKPKPKVVKKAVVNGKPKSNAAAMREKITSLRSEGKVPEEMLDHLMDFAMSLGFKTKGAAASCVNGWLKRV